MPIEQAKQKMKGVSNLFLNRKLFICLIGAWILALVIRLTMFAWYQHTFVTLDEPTYGYIFAIRAHNLLKGRGMVGHDRQVIYAIKQSVDGHEMKDMNEITVLEPTDGYYPDDYETPGYSIWIAAVWKLFGRERFRDFQLMQAIVSSLMVFPIFLMARRFFSDRISILAAFVWAVYLPEARFAMMSLRDVWVTWGCILFTWAFLETKPEKDSPRHLNWVFWSILAGLFGALTAYMRSSTLLYMPFVCASVFFIWGFRHTFRTSLVVGIVMFISLLPWAKRNHDLFGAWELRGWFHYALLSGLCEADTSLYKLDPLRDQDGIDPLTIPDSSRTAIGPSDEKFKQSVIQVYRDRPLWIIKIASQRFLKAIFCPYVWGINDDVYISSRNESLNQRLHTYLNHPFLIFKWVFEKLMYPAVIVAFFIFRNRRPVNIIFIASMLYFPIFHGATIFQARYILPGTWAICIFLAQYIDLLLVKIRGERPEPL